MRSGDSITLPQHIFGDVFDKLKIGIIKVNLSGDFTYVNPAGYHICGMSEWQGRNIRELFPDDEDRTKVLHNLEERKKGIANRYEVRLTRLSNHRKVLITVVAVPEINLSDEIIGSIAWVDLALQEFVDKINESIESLADPNAIMHKLATTVGELVPFDLFNISLYNTSLTHARVLIAYSTAQEAPTWQSRWYPRTPLAKRFLDNRDPIIIGDVQAWLDQPEHSSLKESHGVSEYLAQGFRSSLWYPVLRESRVVASILLSSRTPQAYDELDREILAKMPLTKAVMMALYLLEKAELEFRLNLIRQISSSVDEPRKVSQEFARQIAQHYGWDNVSVFQVDEEAGKIKLMSQDGTPEFRLNENYKQELTDGILGHVYKTKRGVNEPDVTKSEQFRDIFIRGFKGSRSELCLPVIVDDQVRWIVNVEDHYVNAFSQEEQEILQTMINGLSEFLNKVAFYHQYSAIVKSASDAIVLTDESGIIRQVNQATTELLGYDSSELIGTSFANYIRDKEDAWHMLKARRVVSDEFTFLDKNGKYLPMLVSGASLGYEFGRKVYICSDLRLRQRVEKLEILHRMYHEIASQIQPPISLCFSWLRRLKAVEDEPRAEVLEKTLQQLHKLELTFDRLSLFERDQTTLPYNEMLLDIPYVFNGIMDQLPLTEAAYVDVTYDKALPPVRGDIFQLSFCIESILSYLLRHVTKGAKIHLAACLSEGKVLVTIQGPIPDMMPATAKEVTAASWTARTIFEMATGVNIVRGFIEKHRGTFYEPERVNHEMVFRFELLTRAYKV